MSLSEDVPTQKKGTVLLAWVPASVRDHLEGQEKSAESAKLVCECLPLRISAVHVCLPDTAAARTIRAILLTVMGKALRKVVKIHSGTSYAICIASGLS